MNGADDDRDIISDAVSSRNVLMVVLEPVPAEEIRTAVQERMGQTDVTVHVVAPAVNVGTLQWLTGADDDARAEAARIAVETSDAIDAEVEAEVGDRDPLLAVEDALSTFAADEIVLAGDVSAQTEAALGRFGLPVSHVDGRTVGTAEQSAAGALAHDVASGEAPQTPLVLLGAVGAVALGAIVFVSVLTFVIVWLA